MRTVINVFETIELKSESGIWTPVEAKIDTGAYRTSIDLSLAKKLGIYSPEKIIDTIEYRNAIGRFQERPIINCTIKIAGIEIESKANVVDRSHMSYPVLVGRRDLELFSIEYHPRHEVEGNAKD